MRSEAWQRLQICSESSKGEMSWSCSIWCSAWQSVQVGGFPFAAGQSLAMDTLFDLGCFRGMAGAARGGQAAALERGLDAADCGDVVGAAAVLAGGGDVLASFLPFAFTWA